MTATDRLAALEQAHAAATPGPWAVEQNYIDFGVKDNSKTLRDENGRELGAVYLWHPGEDNAAAIVAEHNATPALIAALRAVLDLADELAGRTKAYDAAAHAGEADTFDNGVAAGEATAYEDTARALLSAIDAALGEVTP